MEQRGTHHGNAALQAVVFDFDGTLADTRPAITATVAETLSALARPPLSELEVVRRIGLPLPEIFRAAGLPAAELPRAVTHYRATFPRHAHHVRAFPGALPCLERLRQRGLHLGIASSRGRSSLLELVDSLGFRPFIEHVLGDEDATHKKPAPDLVVTLAERSGVAAQRMLVVGDTSYDIAMGRAAGARTCGVTHGSHGRDLLAQAGADFLIDHLDQLDPIA